jgi:hypothetical protein
MNLRALLAALLLAGCQPPSQPAHPIRAPELAGPYFEFGRTYLMYEHDWPIMTGHLFSSYRECIVSAIANTKSGWAATQCYASIPNSIVKTDLGTVELNDVGDVKHFIPDRTDKFRGF